MTKPFKYLILVIIALLFMAGCKVGPNYERPEINTPSEYIYDPYQNDTILNIAWWDLFQDEVLDSLIREALENNLTIGQAAAVIEESRAFVSFNKANMGPKIGYDGSFNYSNMADMYDPEGNGNGRISAAAPILNWELDFWGKYRRGTEAARAELLASEYGYRAVQISLICEVASTYFTLLDYDQRLYTSQMTLQTRRDYLGIIQERYNKGIIPEIELNQAQIQEAIAASSVPYYERQVAVTEHALSILLGRNPGKIDRTAKLLDQPIPPEIPAGIPSQILERRPDVLYAEQMLAAQTARIGVAQAARFPSISLTGLLGIASAELSGMTLGNSWYYSVGAGLMGPIFYWGQNKRRVEIERYRAEQAVQDYKSTVLQAFSDVENALINVSTTQAEYEAIIRRVDASRNANYLSKQRYDGGVTSYLEVLDSERSLFDAELSASDAYQRQLNAYVGLYKSLGGGWISREEMAADTVTSN